MRGMWRNQRALWYCPYLGKERLYNQYGGETGETRVVYGDAVQLFANVSAATGAAQVEQFGDLQNYDKVICPLPADCPITESDVLFIDKAPEYREAEIYDVTRTEDDEGEHIEVAVKTVKIPLFDYTVRRVAKSLNAVSVAVSKVSVS